MTEHEVRVRRLVPMLVAEFGDTRTAEEIRACADAVLEDFDDLHLPGFPMTVARRRTRECLRAHQCPTTLDR
jgi:hypothetical protein